MHPGIHAESDPDKPALIMAASGQTLSFREFEYLSRRCAQLFRSRGLKPGDAIALCLENHPWFLPICWGAHRAGLTYTCLATHLGGDEAAYIVSDCGAGLYIGSAAKADVAEALLAAMAGPAHWFMLDGTSAGFEAFEDAVAAQPAEPVVDESEGADMLYSSGTTGRPKGVEVTLSGDPLGTVNPRWEALGALYGMTAEAIYLSPAPLYHAAPLRFCLGFLRRGATLVIMERFDAEAALATIARYRVSHSQWVPTMFVRMLKLAPAARAEHDLSSLKIAIHAAAPCPIPVKEQMIAWWGPILHEYYAGTEGNGITVIDSAAWLAHKGSVGQPATGEVHICDEDGMELPAGETGVVYFGGGDDFAYHNDPDKTASAHHAKGWTTLGDVGHVDGDGYLYITDSLANTIISGGVNIYPQEIENLLVMHPTVLDAAVFGIPHEELGEQVHAVVQPVSGAEASAAELLGYCRDHLSHVKCPRSLDFSEELPRQANGKLYKRLLKEPYWR